jgi:WD40 repeat protein
VTRGDCHGVKEGKMSSQKSKHWIWILIGCLGVSIVLCIVLNAIAQIPIFWERNTPYQRPTAAISPQNASQVTLLCEIPDVLFVGWMPDSRQLVVKDKEDGIRFLDTANLQVTRTISPKVGYCLAISPDGRWLAWALRDRTAVKIMDLASGNEWQLPKMIDPKYPHEASQVGCVKFSPDSKVVAVATTWSLVLVDVDSGKEMISTELKGRLERSAFSPDGHIFAFAGEGKGINLWDIKRGTFRTLDVTGDAESVAFSPDGQRLFSMVHTPEWTNVFKIWDVASWNELSSPAFPTVVGVPWFPQDGGGVPVFSPDGRLMVFVRKDFDLWEFDTNKRLAGIRRRLDYYFDAMAFSPDGRLLTISEYRTEGLCGGCITDRALRLFGVK